MAIQTLKTIKNWFRTGLKPTQIQFWDTWDSFRHKDDKIPLEDIENIDQITGQKIIPSGEFLIFKVAPNTADELEIGDSVIGYCEGNFLAEATYYGGDTSLMSSFTKPNNLVGKILSFTTNTQYLYDSITYELNDEILLRSTSCGAYNGIAILYKRPGELGFSTSWPMGYYPELNVTWLDFTPGTVLKLTDTLGDFEDSEEFIIS